MGVGTEQASPGPNGVLSWAALRAHVRRKRRALEWAAEQATLPGRMREGEGKEGHAGTRPPTILGQNGLQEKIEKKKTFSFSGFCKLAPNSN